MARKVLSGTLSISGVAKVGETLTVEAVLNGAVLNEEDVYKRQAAEQ